MKQECEKQKVITKRKKFYTFKLLLYSMVLLAVKKDYGVLIQLNSFHQLCLHIH